MIALSNFSMTLWEEPEKCSALRISNKNFRNHWTYTWRKIKDIFTDSFWRYCKLKKQKQLAKGNAVCVSSYERYVGDLRAQSYLLDSFIAFMSGIVFIRGARFPQTWGYYFGFENKLDAHADVAKSSKKLQVRSLHNNMQLTQWWKLKWWRDFFIQTPNKWIWKRFFNLHLILTLKHARRMFLPTGRFL